LSSAVDEIVDRVSGAYVFASRMVALIGFSPVVVVFASAGEKPLQVLKKYFSLIALYYFGIFEVLLHGDFV